MKEKWDYFELHHGHVSFFNPGSMRELARRTGFTLSAVETKRVSLYQEKHVSKLRFRLSKIITDSLNEPAKLLNKGHAGLFFLRKK